MRHIILSILTIALLFSCGSADTKTTDTVAEIKPVVDMKNGWSTRHLKGKVKTIEESYYTPDENGKTAEMDTCCVEVREFNDKGYSINFSEKDRDGKVIVESIMEREADGKFKSTKRMKNGVQVWGRTLTRDADGKTLYAADSDTTGQVTRIHTVLEENELEQAVHGTTHTPDSVYLGAWSWKYTDGMRTGGAWADSTGTVKSDRTGVLNDKGYLAKKTIMSLEEDGSKKIVVETYTYDSFDELGNWTQRSKFVDDKLDKIEKRTYTFFKEG